MWLRAQFYKQNWKIISDEVWGKNYNLAWELHILFYVTVENAV